MERKKGESAVTGTICKVEDAQFIFEEVLQWGCPLSELLIESPCQTFRLPGMDGFIGYFLKGNTAVVAGDPVCPKENTIPLTEAFYADCTEKGLNIIYFVVSESFADWAVQHHAPVKIQIGEELIYDPFHNPLEGSKSNKLRNKVHHAKNLGLYVEEYRGHDRKVEEGLNELIQSWGAARQGPQIYLGDIALFQQREGRRWFYIRDEARYCGIALIKRLDVFDGWLLKNNVVLQDSPRGTSELLVISLLEQLRQENCRYLTYGLVPSENIDDIAGLNGLSTLFAKTTFSAAKWFFNLGQRKTFWMQFHPSTKKAYILFSKKGLNVSDVRAMLSILKMRF